MPFFRKSTPQERRRKLLESLRARFRMNRQRAIKSIKESYADANVLHSEYGTSILAYSQKRRTIISGEIIDYPTITPALVADESDDFGREIDDLRAKFERFEEFCKTGSPLSMIFDLGMDEYQDIVRGYKFEIFDSRRIRSCSLFFNDEEIWSSGIEKGGNVESLITALERKWHFSSQMSDKEFLDIKIDIEFFAIAFEEVRSWSSVYIGGGQLSGKAKANFTRHTIDPLVDFVGALPVWTGDEDQWLEKVLALEFHDGRL
ncbi:hypothetical protein ACLBKT_07525 [Erythrobacter sp. W302b]|uniref:hypothetical protein n=1 Tax=Erythrobacter sp. W302b TaxID=3389874 RepID=UPI00396AFAD3